MLLLFFYLESLTTQSNEGRRLVKFTYFSLNLKEKAIYLNVEEILWMGGRKKVIKGLGQRTEATNFEETMTTDLCWKSKTLKY